jgi:DNA helicase-2/ATP-dependent DNA helicase PcrA
MEDYPGGLACAYCGGRHATVADVRQCWQRTGGATTSPSSEEEPEEEEAGTTGPVADEAVTVEPGVDRPAPRPRPAAPVPSGPRNWGPVLGRSVVVAPGQSPPPAWEGCARADGAGGDLGALEEAWRGRVPLVIEVPEELAGDEVEHAPVWSLSPSFAFEGERRAHAVFANAVDARGGEPRWAWAEMAVRLGATAGGPGDVLLADGAPAYCDGGPLEWRGPLDGAAVVPRASILAGSLSPFGANSTGAALAPDQLAAVVHPGGAARIIAPAGSGKTRVLTERARHMLRRWQLPGRAVTMVAFNKRAADEMSERTPDLPELQVRTLNALGLSLLTSSKGAGGGRSVTTIEERDVRTILGTLVDLPRRANVDPAVAWIEALSAVRLGLQSPAEVEAEFDGDVDGLAEVFDRYRGLLADRGVVDFDEQVYRAIEVLLTDPAARRRARGACRVLLVDEFQDLTPAHLLLVRLLAGPDGAVYGVGDDDQTIYGYSGASPEWLIDFSRYFPTAGAHPLEVNYRCPVAVVDAARNLLTRNRRRVPKRIVAAPGREVVGDGLQVTKTDAPLLATVAIVMEALERGVPPKDVAVLTRVNASLAPVQVALVDRGAPVRPAVDLTYLSRGGVQAALAWLRLAVAPDDLLAGPDVAVAARRPSRGLSPKVIEWMSERPSMARLQRLADRLKNRDADKVSSFVSDLAMVRRRASSGTTADVMQAVRDNVGLDQAMELLEGSRRRLDRSAQTDDLDALVALASLHPDPRGFEDWLRHALGQGGSMDGVVLSTIHRVKGREWPHVVVHEASAGLLPHRLAVDVEEERRIFHVGLTRGSASVHVVAGDPPSPFLSELAAAGVPDEMGGRAQRDISTGALGRPRVGPTDREGGRRGAYRGPAKPGKAESPARGAVVAPEVADRVRRALQAWRSARASKERKPPYVYLHDRTLEALATEAPSTMAALAQVNGIGPSKLESYGEELLALVAAAREGDAAPGD